MNRIPIELCERNSYYQTMKLLKKEVKKPDPLQRLDSFIRSMKQARDKNREIAKPKCKLSFEVNIKFTVGEINLKN